MKRLALIFFILSVNQFAFAEDNYSLAQKSLAKNDCEAAISYLELFKTQNKDNLKKHADFASKIDEQISICMSRLKQSPNTTISASVKGDADEGDMQKEKDVKQFDSSISSKLPTSKKIQGDF